ncbi:MAG: DNA-protecting protein DprA, partial [Candidatus Coatesbacteria bacterium]|nr:DNA-protecting protein DprA [Candidatus Coatesbacteria bacterium]
KIYNTLTQEPLHIDEITLATDLPQAKIGMGLFNLEMKGLAKELPGKLFVRTL